MSGKNVKKLAAIALFAVLFSVYPAFGDSVNVGASGTDGASWIFGGADIAGLGSVQETLATQFTLSAATQIDQVSLGVQDLNSSGLQYGVSIVSSLTGGTTLWSALLEGSNPVASTSFTLPAGTYFLVAPTTPVGNANANPQFTWTESAGTLSQAGGTVVNGVWADALIDGADTGWQLFSTTGPDNLINSLVFDVSGNSPVAPTPEPTTLLLFSTGLVALALLFRGRRRKNARAASL